jgi:hypothetical protein
LGNGGAMGKSMNLPYKVYRDINPDGTESYMVYRNLPGGKSEPYGEYLADDAELAEILKANSDKYDECDWRE